MMKITAAGVDRAKPRGLKYTSTPNWDPTGSRMNSGAAAKATKDGDGGTGVSRSLGVHTTSKSR